MNYCACCGSLIHVGFCLHLFTAGLLLTVQWTRGRSVAGLSVCMSDGIFRARRVPCANLSTPCGHNWLHGTTYLPCVIGHGAGSEWSGCSCMAVQTPLPPRTPAVDNLLCYRPSSTRPKVAIGASLPLDRWTAELQGASSIAYSCLGQRLAGQVYAAVNRIRGHVLNLMYVCMYGSFISGGSAHKTSKQTNEQTDRWTDRQKHSQANYDAKCSHTQLSYY